MSEYYTPSTGEVLRMLGSYLYEYGAECDMNLPGNSPNEIVDRWLTKRDAEVAAEASVKAWDELAEYVAYVQDSAEGEYFKSQNPYRKEVD